MKLSHLRMDDKGFDSHRSHGKGNAGMPALNAIMFIKRFWEKIIKGVPTTPVSPPRNAMVIRWFIVFLAAT